MALVLEVLLKENVNAANLQMHENLHKNVYEEQFKQQICYSFIMLISYTLFNLLL